MPASYSVRSMLQAESRRRMRASIIAYRCHSSCHSGEQADHLRVSGLEPAKGTGAQTRGDKCVSPWALIWRDENYYLAAYDSEAKVIKHYRVDKMGQVEVTVSPREGVKQFSQIDVTSYTNQTFGMFAGEESVVTMEFPKRLTGVVLDRFGREVDLRSMSEYHVPDACKGGRQRTVLRMACRNRTGCPDRSAGNSTEALCTVAFGHFAGTVTEAQNKNVSKISQSFFV